MFLQPSSDGRQKLFFKLVFVTNEIVIHKEHPSAPAAGVQVIEFRDDLHKSNVGKILRRELRDEELKKLDS